MATQSNPTTQYVATRMAQNETVLQDLDALVRMVNLKLQDAGRGKRPLHLERGTLGNLRPSGQVGPYTDKVNQGLNTRVRLTGLVLTHWMRKAEAAALLRFGVVVLDRQRELDVAASRVPDGDEEEPDQFGHGKEDDS